MWEHCCQFLSLVCENQLSARGADTHEPPQTAGAHKYLMPFDAILIPRLEDVNVWWSLWRVWIPHWKCTYIGVHMCKCVVTYEKQYLWSCWTFTLNSQFIVLSHDGIVYMNDQFEWKVQNPLHVRTRYSSAKSLLSFLHFSSHVVHMELFGKLCVQVTRDGLTVIAREQCLVGWKSPQAPS